MAGITIGLTCFIILASYIQYERSYDRQHEKSDRIYRVAQTEKGNEYRGTDKFASAPITLVPAIKQLFPEVENGTTVTFRQTKFFLGEQACNEPGIYADEYFLNVFSYAVLEGVGKEALKDQDALLLTESMARKYFGNTSPIGKTMQLDGDLELVVKGVIEDVPHNQHFDFEFITSIKNFTEYEGDLNRWKWSSNNYLAYIVLPPKYDYRNLTDRMGSLTELAKPYYADYSFFPEYFLQPLRDIHLHSHINMEIGTNGDIRYVNFATVIAFIILFLALINYMNLSISQASNRLKEVGIQKVLGANRSQLTAQFLGETVIIVLSSLCLAIGLASLFLPKLSQMLDENIPFTLGDSQILVPGFMAIAIILGICAGIYPALVLSATDPSLALKGKWLGSRRDGSLLSRFLLVGQFTAAIVLAIGSAVVYQQMKFIQSTKLGYNRDQVMYIPYYDQEMIRKAVTLKSELLKHPGIDKVCLSNTMLLNSENQGIVDQWEGNESRRELWIYRNWVDNEFLDLFEIEIVEGRGFTSGFVSDSMNSYLLNERALGSLGWKSAVGKSFADGKVIGVVKDFHFQPFNLAIEPMFIQYHNEYTSRYGNIVLKVNTDDYRSVAKYAEEKVKELLPALPFDLKFMDDSFNHLYRSERNLGAVLGFFTLIALMISSMGLFGLISHHVIKRGKEIGIRKVLGASVSNVVSMLSKDFLVLVLISALMAIPFAWWMTERWLENFVYRIEISGWVFLFNTSIALVVALVTVGSQSLRAALANPVETIKEE